MIEPSNAYESHFAKRPPQQSTVALTICAALIAERALAWNGLGHKVVATETGAHKRRHPSFYRH
jgi:hypothetical protein